MWSLVLQLSIALGLGSHWGVTTTVLNSGFVTTVWNSVGFGEKLAVQAVLTSNCIGQNSFGVGFTSTDINNTNCNFSRKALKHQMSVHHTTPLM